MAVWLAFVIEKLEFVFVKKSDTLYCDVRNLVIELCISLFFVFLQFTWPEIDKDSELKENKMIYKFDYLPAGLFNRGQVSLVPKITLLKCSTCYIIQTFW